MGAIGGIAGLVSAYFSWRQWQNIKRKIGMITNADKAAEILPAWYTTRMMRDWWLFGLVTSDGRIIAITRITSVSDDGRWMDVELAEAADVAGLTEQYGTLISAVAPDRTDASIQIPNIVAAIELQTS